MMTCDLFAIDAPLMLLTKRPVIREADRTLKRYGAMPPAMMIDLSVRGDCHAKMLLRMGKRM
jgi:predicted nuclease with RNAse H fold